mmetsp:Transcript_41530/g.120181  ORF Transcript_41530/g.120181 Transcript_41530/m.120181 type:complete len:420 (+) Transcript_41530:86-1345(+)
MATLLGVLGRATCQLRQLPAFSEVLHALPLGCRRARHLEPLCLLPAARRLLSSPALRRSQEAWQARPPNVHNAETRGAEFGRSSENVAATPEIMELGKKGQWDKARTRFRSVASPDTILYNVVLTAADRCGRYAEGLQLFAEMRKAQVKLTGVSYAGALTLLGRLGQHDEARVLWDELRAAGVSPTPACLTGLLNAAASNGKIRDVEERLAQARAEGLELFTTHLNCLVRTARELQQPQRALEAVRSIEEYGLQPDVVSYTLAMGACARAVGTGAMSFEAAQAYIQTIAGEMAAKGLAANAFFLEEELSALLGIWPLRRLMEGNLLAGRSPADATIQAAKAALAAATQLGIRKTFLVDIVVGRLRSLEAASVAGPPPTLPPAPAALPAGWCQALDPTSGRPYYWQEADPALTTTWQHPA